MERLSESDFREAALELDVPVNLVKAVVEVESSGSGFQSDGKPKILFERHHFHRHTGGIYSSRYPNISNRKAGGYTRDEWKRFDQAAALDKRAAILSASWGLFQILGSNHAICGYRTPEEFAAAMYESERKHLDAFVSFIRVNGLDRHLRARNYAAFARGYNGPAYSKNSYDVKIRDAFQRLERQTAAQNTITRDEVRDVQSRLMRAGINPGPIDGLMGPRTAAAIREFQRKNNLPIAGQLTRDVLVSVRSLT